MSIYIVEGKPGAGKSYHTLVNDILPALKAGRPLYTNMAGLNTQLIALALDVPRMDINISMIDKREDWIQLLDWKESDKEGATLKFPKASLFVIDEAQMIWNSREFKNTTKGFTDLLAYHRHFGLDFCFLTQDAKLLDVNISRICEGCFTIKNLSFLSTALLKKHYVIQFKQRPRDPIVSTDRGSYNEKYFPLYQSMVAANPYKKKSITSFGSMKVALAVGALVYTCVSMYAHGFAFQRKGKLNVAKNPSALSGVASLSATEKLDLKDSLANRQLIAPLPATYPQGTKAVAPAMAIADGIQTPEQAKKLCVDVPQKGTWAITMNGKTERGWSNYTKTVCY